MGTRWANLGHEEAPGSHGVRGYNTMPFLPRTNVFQGSGRSPRSQRCNRMGTTGPVAQVSQGRAQEPAQGPAQELGSELELEHEVEEVEEVEVWVASLVSEVVEVGAEVVVACLSLAVSSSPDVCGRNTMFFWRCSTSHPQSNRKAPGYPLVMVWVQRAGLSRLSFLCGFHLSTPSSCHREGLEEAAPLSAQGSMVSVSSHCKWSQPHGHSSQHPHPHSRILAPA